MSLIDIFPTLVKIHFLPMRFINQILELLFSYFQFRFIYPALEDCSLPDSQPKELRPLQKLFLAQLPDSMLECVLDFLPYWEDSFARTCKHWKGLSRLHQTHLIRSSPLFRSFEPENMVPLDLGTLSLLQIKFNWSLLEKSKFWSTSLLAALAARRIRSPYANELTCRLFKACVKFGGFGKELLCSVILYGKETKNYELFCLLLENGAKFSDFPDMFEFSKFIFGSNDDGTKQDLKFVIESLKRAYRHNKDILPIIPLNGNPSCWLKMVLLYVHASMDFDGSLLSHIGPQLDAEIKLGILRFLFDLDPSSLNETDRKMVYDRNIRLLYQFISEVLNNVKADQQYLLLNEWRYGAHNVDESQLKNLNLDSILQLQCINTAIKTKKISVFGRKVFEYDHKRTAFFPFHTSDFPKFNCSRDTNSFRINFHGKDFADFLRDCYIILNFSSSIEQDRFHNFREDDCVLSEYFNSLSLSQIEELIQKGNLPSSASFSIAIRFTDNIAIFKLALSKITTFYRCVSFSTYKLVFQLLCEFRNEKDDLIDWLLVLFESIKANLLITELPQALTYENCKLDLTLKLISNSCVQDLIVNNIIRLDFRVSADQIFEGCIQTDRFFKEFTSQDMFMCRLDILELFNRSIYRCETIRAVERLAKIAELDTFLHHHMHFHSIPFLEQVKALFTGTNYELIICLAPFIEYWKAADFVHFETKFPERWKDVYIEYLQLKTETSNTCN